MNRESTSPAPAASGAISARGEWARYLAFLGRPRVPECAAPIGARSVIAVLRMLGLDLLVMLGLVMIAGVVLLIGFELPENELAGMDLTPMLVFAIVIIAPLSEETVFRGWLSGRPGHVLAVLLVVAAFVVVTFTDIARSEAEVNLKVIGLFVGALLSAALALFALRRHGAMRWFAWAFPLFFWLATAGFALVHLLNYTEGASAVLLPLVIPQLVVGSILGYVRVHYGLWASMLLHALHNGAAVGAVLLAVSLGA